MDGPRQFADFCNSLKTAKRCTSELDS